MNKIIVSQEGSAPIEISLEDGKQISSPAAADKKTFPIPKGVLILAGLGVAGYVLAGGAVGINGMINGAKGASTAIGNISGNEPAAKIMAAPLGMMAGRKAALTGHGETFQKLAGGARALKYVSIN